MNPIKNRKLFYSAILIILALIITLAIIIFSKTNDNFKLGKDSYNLPPNKVMLSEEQVANKKALIAEVESKGSVKLSPEEIAKKEKILRELLAK